MQTPRPRPGRPPPGAGGGRRRRDGRRRRPPHPRGGRRHRAWRAPAGGWHRRAREGVGGKRGGFRAHRQRAQGAQEGALERVGAPDVGRLEGQTPALRPLGNFSGSRTPASVSNYPILSTEEAGTPACWVGRGVWGQGQRPSPPPVSGGRVGWREGVVSVLKAERFAKRFRALNGFISPRGRAIRLSLLWMGKLSHARCTPRG